MVKRRARIFSLTGLPTSGRAVQVIGENAQRVSLHFQSEGNGNVLLYDNPAQIDLATGAPGYWLLLTAGATVQPGENELHFRHRDSCPKNAFFAGAAAAVGRLRIIEVTEEDIG